MLTIRDLLLVLVFFLLGVLACSLPERLLATPSPQGPTSASTPTITPELMLSPTDIVPTWDEIEPTATPIVEVEVWQLVQHERQADLPEVDFTMLVQYPLIEGSDHENVRWFNDLVEDFVQHEIDENHSWLADTEPLDGISMFAEVYYSIPSARDWRLDGAEPDLRRRPADAVLLQAGHDVLGVLFVNFYYFGGAHPGSSYRAINYDFTTGRELALNDLFVPGAAYLERMAEYCSEQLLARLEFEIWEDGVAPELENYQDWVVTPLGLLIVFEEYQVAPYAAGPQQVVVPYDLLTDLIHPMGPIGGFAVTE
jgi:hypothetical protein